MGFSGLLRGIRTSPTERSQVDTASAQNLLHFHGHFGWVALSISYRMSLGDGQSFVLSKHGGKDVLAEAVCTEPGTASVTSSTSHPP